MSCLDVFEAECDALCAKGRDASQKAGPMLV
jgi:hypothetical protein